MNARQLISFALLIGFGVYAIAKDVDAKREPASIPKKNGVVCGQGENVTMAEQKLNDKLGQGDTMASMTGKFGKISNAKITGVTVHSLQGTPQTIVLCASVTGD